jgi:hypothetical protein
MRTSLQKKILISVVMVSSLLLSTPTQAATKNIAGTGCKKAGSSQFASGKTYVCTLVGKKLAWKIKATPAPTPAAPTWAEIEAEKAAAAAKAAEEVRLKEEAAAKAAAELKAKQDAEAKAADELKLKQEAEAKAAKIEAERPKIQGLTIGNALRASLILALV